MLIRSSMNHYNLPFFSLLYRFLGCSGQNIDDLFRHVQTENRIEIAEKTLAWRNIAPTTPDSLCKLQILSYCVYISLDCYPFYEKDPFVISETPHVYFIGNQPRYDTKIIEGIKCDSYILFNC